MVSIYIILAKLSLGDRVSTREKEASTLFSLSLWSRIKVDSRAESAQVPLVMIYISLSYYIMILCIDGIKSFSLLYISSIYTIIIRGTPVLGYGNPSTIAYSV